MQPDLDPGPGDPGVGGEEVLRQQEPELLRTGDAALLGQDVHRVLLAVRGDDVRVVSRLIILTIINLYLDNGCECVYRHLGVVQGEQCGNLQLPDGVLPALPGHVHDLDASLNTMSDF